MKNLVSTHILCLLFLIACANNNNQIPKSLSLSYDGIWDGYAQITEENVYYAQTPEDRIYIKAEIKNGIVSGFIEDSAIFNDFGTDVVIEFNREINGYINSDNNLIIKPAYIFYSGHWGKHYPRTKIVIETNLMSPNRIEGTYHADRFDQTHKYDWFIVKPATGKSDITISNAKSDIPISNIKINEKEPWTGKFKLESNYHCSGIWAMKQEGQIVKSTRDSSDDFKGKVQGNQLKGYIVGSSRTYYRFTLEMSSDSMSFTGTLDLIAHGLPCQLKGKRIE